MKHKITLASNNSHKVKEIQAILGPLGYDVLSMKEVGLGHLEIEENGQTFEENAMIKARAIYELLGGIVLADDSGLEVDYLKGAPGVYSARYAGEPKCDDKNNEKLLLALEGVSQNERTARFVTVLAMIFPDGKEIVVRGEVKGIIGNSPCGEAGFGYDPLFVVPKLEATFAQLSEEEKNKNSHRAAALKKLVERLETV